MDSRRLTSLLLLILRGKVLQQQAVDEDIAAAAAPEKDARRGVVQERDESAREGFITDEEKAQ